MRLRPLALALAVAAVAVTAACGDDSSGTVAAGSLAVPVRYHVEAWAEGLTYPTGIAFASDGSAFVIEKGGFEKEGQGRVLHVAADGSQREVLSLPVCAEFERGLVGVAVAPDFPEDPWIYLYRTRDDGGCDDDSSPFASRSGTVTNRLSRFRWTDGVLDPASEEVLLDHIRGDNVAHHGGGLAFGPDGMLYVAVGNNSRDDDDTVPSRDPGRPEGTILRTTGDPADPVPADNPFVGVEGADPLVFATGLRNPYRLGIHPEDGTVVVGDVGGALQEELNVILPGADYGWPQREGLGDGPIPGDAADAVDPILTYDRSEGCTAIIAGGFLVDDAMGPGTDGTFAFTDFACGKVWLVDVDEPTNRREIAEVPGGHSDLAVGPDGLLYLVGIDGTVWRIQPVG